MMMLTPFIVLSGFVIIALVIAIISHKLQSKRPEIIEKIEYPEIQQLQEKMYQSREFKQKRIEELEDAIRLHRTKRQLVQVEDMELWAILGDGEQ